MTPTEWGRLQGFIGYAFMKDGVDTFSFPEGMTDGQKYKQLGNSVTIPVIEELAHFMLACFDKMTNSQTSLVLKMAKENEYITKKNVMEKLRISANQAGYLLKKLAASCDLKIVTHGRYSKYQITSKT
jgi:DNA (cytosine-5)-methyltransferase 1